MHLVHRGDMCPGNNGCTKPRKSLRWTKGRRGAGLSVGWRTAVKQTKLQPQFVAIAWEDAGEEGTPVTVQAVLCLRHRREIGLQHPTARGWGQFGEACDLCESRGLRTEPIGAVPSA